jgi:hypothetical protein
LCLAAQANQQIMLGTQLQRIEFGYGVRRTSASLTAPLRGLATTNLRQSLHFLRTANSRSGALLRVAAQPAPIGTPGSLDINLAHSQASWGCPASMATEAECGEGLDIKFADRCDHFRRETSLLSRHPLPPLIPPSTPIPNIVGAIWCEDLGRSRQTSASSMTPFSSQPPLCHIV